MSTFCTKNSFIFQVLVKKKIFFLFPYRKRDPIFCFLKIKVLSLSHFRKFFKTIKMSIIYRFINNCFFLFLFLNPINKLTRNLFLVYIPIHSPHMPQRLPIRDIISALFGSIGTAVLFGFIIHKFLKHPKEKFSTLNVRVWKFLL
jgi:hypothetical protein